jgi:hypothetical protein
MGRRGNRIYDGDSQKQKLRKQRAEICRRAQRRFDTAASQQPFTVLLNAMRENRE